MGVNIFQIASVVGSTSAKIAVKFLENYITTYGVPEKNVIDQGTAFTGRQFFASGKFCVRLNIELKFGTPNLQTRTGMLERTIGFIEQILKTLLPD